MIAEKIIEKMGIELPEASAPAAMYLPLVQTGNLIFVSGQIPKTSEGLITGKVGDTVTLEEAQEAARICTINGIAALKAYLGDLDKIKKIVKLQAFVASKTGFDQQHLVANGASQLLFDIFGEAGRHARTAVSVNQLPMDATIEIEFIVEVE